MNNLTSNKTKVLTLADLKKYDSPDESIWSHHKFAKFVIKTIREGQHQPLNSYFVLEENNEVLYGQVNVKLDTFEYDEILPNDGIHSMYFRHAVNRRYVPQFATGANMDLSKDWYVFSSGEKSEKRRNYSSLHMEDHIKDCILETTGSMYVTLDKTKKLKKRQLTLQEVSHFYVTAAKRQVIRYSHIPHIQKYYESEFVSTQTGEKTKRQNALNLWKAFMESYDKLGTTDRFNFLIKLPSLFDELSFGGN